jgi:hemolysin activation/secretion protein
LLYALDAFPQSSYIDVNWVGNPPEKININLDEPYADSTSVIQELKSIRQSLLDLGYLTASIDSVSWAEDTSRAYIYAGRLHQWAELKPGNVPEEYLSKIGYREKVYRGEKFSPSGFSNLVEGLLKMGENNGYPFAELSLDSILIEEEGISARLNLNRNTFFVIDSLVLKGDNEANRTYIENHLGLKMGMAYDQSLLNKIPTRLKELPFVSVIKPYEIGMRPGKADVYLYLENKKASNFDGVLGVLPDSETDEIIITGDIRLNLLNSFKRGEKINLQWQRLQTRTQQLDLNFEYPFLFNTPLGVQFQFNLYRQDTLFSQVNSMAGVQYYFLGANSAEIYYENNQANVLSTSIQSLDRYVDSRTNLFGIGLNTSDLDYRFNPRRGYFIEARAAAGQKEILRNQQIDDSEYEGIDLKSDIYNGRFHGGLYIPFGKRSTILVRMRSATLLNDNLFRNELYRIGGLKTLRGFNEQAIFASSYAIGTIEYRFILEENSNIFAFFDQGWYEDRVRADAIRDTPFGFGAGISFETGAGIFSLTYALGKQFDNEIQVRDGKIHFGFISFF